MMLMPWSCPVRGSEGHLGKWIHTYSSGFGDEKSRFSELGLARSLWVS